VTANSIRRAVFLDRDGVINRSHVVDGKPYAPRHLTDFHLLPGAAASVDALVEAGFLVFVVTNQPDIGNRRVDPAAVEAMHDRLRGRLKVVDIYCCPHRQDEGCACRKPAAGMLLEAAERYSLDLAASYMVGDRSSDIEAGQKAGCSTIFIDRRYAEKLRVRPDATVGSLPAAVRHILVTNGMAA
jgi:histidinol-phosphate phosphatase family domain/HAD-superfamily hydrolase, subfamily IIIA